MRRVLGFALLLGLAGEAALTVQAAPPPEPKVTPVSTKKKGRGRAKKS